MAINYHNKILMLSDIVGVEDAETLLALRQKHPKAKLDLSACTHLHAACLQVLMASRPVVSAWPSVPNLTALLQSALRN